MGAASLLMLTNKALDGWSLLSLIAVAISLTVVMAMASADLSSASGVSSMIQLSVRCSVPWLYVAFAASSIHMQFHYEDIQSIDHVFYWAGFLAWSTRIVAWSRARWQPVLG